jgi:3-methyladenine DNA glycosylase/8-oxoguanine DNA glycosylase
MARLIERIGPIEVSPRRLHPFQSLTQAVIHQQLSGRAAQTILDRFRALFHGVEFPSPEAVLKMSPETLRSAGLSRPKAGYILNLARRAADGLVPSLEDCDGMTDAALVENLTANKGVGRWTVEMLLIFNLGRPDVLPIHDLGIRRGYQMVFRKRSLPDPDRLARYGARWGPHRTTAAFYLWRAADFLKDGEW